MGKYQKLRGKLEKFKPENQEKIDEFKRTFLEGAENLEGLNLRHTAAIFAETTGRRRELEAQLKSLNVELAGLSQLIVDNLEAEAVQKIELASGELIYLQDTPYPVVESKEKLFAWIKKNKLVNLLTAHHQMLKGMCSQLLLQNKRVPPGVAIFMKTEARVRGASSEEADES